MSTQHQARAIPPPDASCYSETHRCWSILFRNFEKLSPEQRHPQNREEAVAAVKHMNSVILARSLKFTEKQFDRLEQMVNSTKPGEALNKLHEQQIESLTRLKILGPDTNLLDFGAADNAKHFESLWKASQKEWSRISFTHAVMPMARRLDKASRKTQDDEPLAKKPKKEKKDEKSKKELDSIMQDLETQKALFAAEKSKFQRDQLDQGSKLEEERDRVARLKSTCASMQAAAKAQHENRALELRAMELKVQKQSKELGLQQRCLEGIIKSQNQPAATVDIPCSSSASSSPALAPSVLPVDPRAQEQGASSASSSSALAPAVSSVDSHAQASSSALAPAVPSVTYHVQEPGGPVQSTAPAAQVDLYHDIAAVPKKNLSNDQIRQILSAATDACNRTMHFVDNTIATVESQEHSQDPILGDWGPATDDDLEDISGTSGSVHP